MDYKQKYREETNKEPYENVEHKNNFTLDYVKWLEKQLALCNVVGQSEQLKALCENINPLLEANVKPFTIEDLRDIIKVFYTI